MRKILKKILAKFKILKLSRALLKKDIQIETNKTNTQYNFGIDQIKLREYEKAKTYFEKVIQIDPFHKNALINLAGVYALSNEHKKAKDCYEKVIQIDPNSVDAFYNLGVVFVKLGDVQKAKYCYEKVIKIDSNHISALNNLANILLEFGDLQKVKDCFDKIIELDPNYINAHNNLGNYFEKLGEYQKALDCYKRAIEIDPNLVNTYANIANIYIGGLNNFEKAINTSNETLKKHHKNSKFFNQSIPLFRLKHDIQQANYLNSKDYKIKGIDEFIKVGDEILKRKENEGNLVMNKKILLNPNEINSLLPYFKENHIYKTKTISGSCINPNKNWLEVEEEYLNSHNQIMYIDDFLSDEALIELREFCLVSKVWNKEYNNKYLGAFSNNGFISPIHLQIAIDLQKNLPKLFGPHRLGTFWGFKYDATLGKGINIHADFAIHNLNFWITPDEFNNNKNSGGLKVYDAPAPDHWTFQKYNRGKDKIYEFLKENNAKCTNVPYKFNRAVLFNSAYFHETDEIDFKDEYVGRRINNTYLFGTRLVK